MFKPYNNQSFRGSHAWPGRKPDARNNVQGKALPSLFCAPTPTTNTPWRLHHSPEGRFASERYATWLRLHGKRPPSPPLMHGEQVHSQGPPQGSPRNLQSFPMVFWSVCTQTYPTVSATQGTNGSTASRWTPPVFLQWPPYSFS